MDFSLCDSVRNVLCFSALTSAVRRGRRKGAKPGGLVAISQTQVTAAGLLVVLVGLYWWGGVADNIVVVRRRAVALQAGV